MVFLAGSRKIIILWLCCCTGCASIFFHPQKQLLREPDDIGLEYRDVGIQGSAGRLHGWFLPAQGESRGTVLFAHGNAENISTHIAGIHWLPAVGFNVLIFDYRGYGLSQGRPTPRGLVDDMKTVISHLQQLPEVQAKNMVVYGHSLGGSVAISAVAELEDKKHIRGLIVDSAFSGYRKIANDKLSTFWLTALFKWITFFAVTNNPDAEHDIAQIKEIPVLIIHSRVDEVIPFTHGETLFAAANEPKQFWVLESRYHNQGMSDELSRRQFVESLQTMFQSSGKNKK